jgi:GNAT superfamily N-acetyltransferase
MTFEIRLARSADAAAACEVLRRSIVELCGADHHNDRQMLADWLANKTSANVSTWIADTGNAVYVAVDGGRIAGIAAMTKNGMITLNYVSPDFRFRGVTRALLAQLERKAAELGLSECRLDSTKTAERLYRAAGFHEASASGAVCGATPCKAMVKKFAPKSATVR